MIEQIRGFGNTFRKRAGQYVRPVVDIDVIDASIRSILGTGRGERVMRGDFGCNLLGFLQESMSDGLNAQIAEEIREAIELYEPRAVVNDVYVIASSDTSIDVSISYSYQGKNKNLTVKIAGE